MIDRRERLKIGDLAIQTENNSLWRVKRIYARTDWLVECICMHSPIDAWSVGDLCDFDRFPPYDDGVVNLGKSIELDAAIAAAALGAFVRKD